MPWNPVVYNQFKDIRFTPFFDLSALISPEVGMKAVDLGCGTGEQTAILSDKFPQATFLGIDSSPEMLSASGKLENKRLKFENSSVEKFLETAGSWDLIFSNAALQWLDDHRMLFPHLISKLNRGGQLAVQMPYQPDNALNRILFDMAGEEPYRTYLRGWNRSSSVLSIDDYTTLLFHSGLRNLNLSLRIYPIVAIEPDVLYDFVSGSAIIPYLERLAAEKHPDFITDFKARIKQHFLDFPAIYAFKRILLYGQKV